MRHLQVLTSNGYTDEIVYNVTDKFLTNLMPETVRKKRVTYLNICSTFDIETSTIRKNNAQESINYLYLWGAYIDGNVIMGRTWKEFLSYLNILRVKLHLNNYRRLVIYVHNLAYEWQYLKDILHINQVFFKAPRKPLYFLSDGIEFRCSYFLFNKSLSKTISTTPGAVYLKNDGDDFDYKEIRFSDTVLTDSQLSYQYCDVRGLAEAIEYALESDTIASIPLTSTGYVRRYARKILQADPEYMKMFHVKQLTPDQYRLCRKVFRGGNCHANRKYAGKKLYNVKSKDLKSSYPANLCYGDFPVSDFNETTIDNLTDLLYYCNKYACIMMIELYDVTLKKNIPIPYLDIGHCEEIHGYENDNGRVLNAKYLRYPCTSIDFNILIKQYDITMINVAEFYYAEKGKLPLSLINVVMHYFDNKTSLEDVDPYMYARSKELLNAIFGMMVTDIINPEIEYDFDAHTYSKVSSDIYEAVEKYYNSKNSFLSYQDGVFTTANARKMLQDAIDRVGEDVVYVDTDSVKYIGEHEDIFSDINDTRMSMIKTLPYRTYAIKNDGSCATLGLWESDAEYTLFKTLGAKKYAFNTVKKGFGITVSGISKECAKIVGSVDNFTPNTLISSGYYKVKDLKVHRKYINCGRTVVHYNEVLAPTYIFHDGHKIELTSHVIIDDSTYYLDITKDYEKILQKYIDND